MADMMGPAHVDICRRAGKVCIRYVDRPVANGVEIETRSNLRNFKTSRTAAFKTDCRGRMFAAATW